MSDTQEDALITDIIEGKSGSYIGLVRLNRPQALNALSLPMIQALYQQLVQWHQDTSIQAVILASSSEKAFCAGGDVRLLYQSMQECELQANPYAADYFSQEYQLDYLIHSYEKPLIVWGHGFVLGGGLGLFWGASFRVATEKTVFGWPEINIGLYPDVGGTYALSRMPKTLGYWLGMTGSFLDASEGIIAGLADITLPSHAWPNILNALSQIEWGESVAQKKAQVAALLSHHANPELHVQLPSFWLASQPQLQWLFADVEPYELYQRFQTLHQELSRLNSPTPQEQWLLKGCQQFLKGAPRTARIAIEQIRRGHSLDLEACFELEWAISVNCATSMDLLEGIRAQLIDRDKTPTWQEAHFCEQTDLWVQGFFNNPESVPQHIKKRLQAVNELFNKTH